MHIVHLCNMSAFGKAECRHILPEWQVLLHRRFWVQMAGRSGMQLFIHKLHYCSRLLVVRCADLAGLYRGGCITLLRDVPAHAIYFTSYELCHEMFEPGSRQTGIHSPTALFISGTDPGT